jgi:hypothetical protein
VAPGRRLDALSRAAFGYRSRSAAGGCVKKISVSLSSGVRSPVSRRPFEATRTPGRTDRSRLRRSRARVREVSRRAHRGRRSRDPRSARRTTWRFVQLRVGFAYRSIGS